MKISKLTAQHNNLRTTIPADIRRAINFRNGDHVLWVQDTDNSVRMIRIKPTDITTQRKTT